jgi:hypothetical protein
MQPLRRATPPESEPEKPTDSSDSSDVELSSEETNWELSAGGGGAILYKLC